MNMKVKIYLLKNQKVELFCIQGDSHSFIGSVISKHIREL